MPYGRFLREAEPLKVSSCSNCDVELMRSKSVWVLLAVGTLVMALVVGFAIPFAFVHWGAVVAGLSVIIIATVFVFGLNLCGWLFVGWKPVSPTKGGPGPEGS
jgi:hypothetical protein